MGIQDIEKRILDEAQGKAKKIKDEGEAGVASILREGKLHSQELQVELLNQAKAKAEERRRSILVPARLEIKRAILTKKQEKIQAIYNEVLEDLSKLEDKDYKSIIMGMLRKISSYKGNVFPAKGREKVTQMALTELKKECQSQGKEFNLSLGQKSLPIKGGFVLESGHLKIDNSFELFAEKIREETEPQVAGVLFGE